jgi:hypothetical protein
LDKRLANMWSRKKITKKAQAVRGQESIWEIPNETGQAARNYDSLQRQVVSA